MSTTAQPNYIPEDSTGVPYADGDRNVNGWYLDKRETRVHFADGRISKDDGPAVIYKNGSECWYKDGLLNREGDLPAVTILDEKKRVIRQAWHLKGKKHRLTNSPSSVEYTYNGDDEIPSKKSLTYFDHDRISRVGEPAYEVYLKGKDKPDYIEYHDHRFGGLHRANGPAIESKSKKFEEWFFCNVRHCENGGPAIKSKLGEIYYLNGKEVPKKEAVNLFSSGASMLQHILKNYRMEESQKTGKPVVVEEIQSSEEERRAKAKDFVEAWKSKGKSTARSAGNRKF